MILQYNKDYKTLLFACFMQDANYFIDLINAYNLPQAAMPYLESIAWQQEERAEDKKPGRRKNLKIVFNRICRIASKYQDPTQVLRCIDDAMSRCSKIVMSVLQIYFRKKEKFIV